MENSSLARLRSNFAGALALLAIATTYGSAPEEIKPRKGDLIVTVISSTVYNGYRRAQTPDGKAKPETYAFGDGQVLDEGASDRYLEAVTFNDVAKTLAGPLAQQAYVTGVPPDKTDLLIMVKWGATGVLDSSASAGVGMPSSVFMPTELAPGLYSKPNSPMVEALPVQPGMLGGGGAAAAAEDARIAFDMMADSQNRNRDMANAVTARLLGYDGELARIADYQSFGGLRDYRTELIGDLEDARYFVVLVAYDFQKFWKEKQRKLLWITRFSIRSRGGRFDRDLAAMVQMASHYFGRDSGGLKRDIGGKVRLDDIKVLEFEPKK